MALNSLGLGISISAKDTASAIVDHVRQGMTGIKSATDGATRALNDAAGAANRATKGLTETAAAATKAAAGGDAAAASIGRVGKAAEDAQSRAALSMRDIGSQLQTIGLSMMAVGAAGIAGLGLAAAAAGKFQAAIAEISTLVDSNVVSNEKLRDITLRITGLYGGDPTAQAKAFYQTISAGITDLVEAEQLLGVANKFAVAGNTDVTTSVNVLTSVVSAYREQALGAAEASDIMTTTVMLGKVTAEELGHTIGRVAPLAASMGLSFKELNAILATTTMQLSAAESVSGLKAALANVINPTKDATIEAARLGIAFDSTTLRRVGFEAFLKSITGNSKFSADSLEKLFGSVEALNVMQSLAANGGQGLTDSLKAMESSAGATDKAYKKMTATFEHQAKMLQSKLQVAFIKLGEVLLPLLTKAVAGLNLLLDAFNGLPSGAQQAVTWSILFGSALLIVGGAMIALIGTALVMAPMWATIATAAAYAGVALLVVAAVIAALVLVFAGFEMAYRKNLGGFADLIDQVVADVTLAVRALGQLFGTGGFEGDVLDSLNNGKGYVRDFAIQVYMWVGRIGNFFSSIGSGFEAGITELTPAFTLLVESIRKLGFVLGFTKDSAADAQSTWNAFGAVGDAIGRGLAFAFGLVVYAVQLLVSYWTGLVAGFKSAGPVLAFLQTSFRILYEALATTFNSIKESVGTTNNASDSWMNFGFTVGQVVATITYGIGAFIQVIALMVKTVGAMVGGVVTSFMGMFTGISGAFTLLRGLLAGDGATMWLGFKMMIFGVIQGILGLVGSFLEAIAGMVDSLGKAVGKDFGLQKAVQGGKADMLKDLSKGLGLEDKPGTLAADPRNAAKQGAFGEPGRAENEAKLAFTEAKLAAMTPEQRAASGGPQSQASATIGKDEIAKSAPQGAMAPLSPATMPAAAGPAAPGGAFPSFGAPSQPVQVTVNSVLTLDGQQIASAVSKANVDAANRGFGPTPLPT